MKKLQISKYAGTIFLKKLRFEKYPDKFSKKMIISKKVLTRLSKG